MPFVDTDEKIVRSHGAIARIFTREGEGAFRRYERAAIAAALARKTPSVIAVGGGAPSHGPSRALLAEKSYRIFLFVSTERIERRVRRSPIIRPMLGARATREGIVALYRERLPFYREAEFVLDCTGLTKRRICDAIGEHLTKIGAA